MSFRTSFSARKFKKEFGSDKVAFDSNSQKCLVKNPSLFKQMYQLSDQKKEELEDYQRNIKQTQRNAFKYKLYSKEYLEYYKLHEIIKFTALKLAFPDVDFTIEPRLKSEHSHMEKCKNKGSDHDLLADKITVYSVNGETDEEVLKKECYKIKDFLFVYHTGPSFSEHLADTCCLSERNLPNYKETISEIPDRFKDYIAHSKEGGYQSLHSTYLISFTNHLGDLKKMEAETQIKTFRMREREKYGQCNHSKLYKDRSVLLNNIHSRNDAEYYLPLYLEFFNNKSGLLDIKEKTFERRFKYYFGLKANDFFRKDRDIPSL